MQTTVYAAQTALLGLLNGIPELSDATIQLGHPARFGKRDVWIGGDVEDWQLEYRQSGLVARDEFYTLRINVLVVLTGTNNYVKTRDAVKAYTDKIEEALGDDPTLGGAVLLATVTGATLDEGIGQDGRSRMVLETLAVRIRAHVDAG